MSEGRSLLRTDRPSDIAALHVSSTQLSLRPMNSPPLFVSFPDLTTFIHALKPEDEGETENILSGLAQRRLPPVVSANSLAVLFGYSTRFVMSMAWQPHKFYREFTLPRGRRPRIIHAPRVSLKVIQKWIGYHLSRSRSLPANVHGFVPGRSTVTAATQHLGADWLLSVDLRDFFPSTSRAEVRSIFDGLGYPDRASRVLTDLTTVRRSLPQGSPASPVLANLVFEQTDVKLKNIAEERNIIYTRYADDIVFSGAGSVPAGLLAGISQIIEDSGWSLAENKTACRSQPLALRVHGILVHGSALRLPKLYRNRLRRMRFALDKKVLPEQTARRYRGHLAYAAAVEDRGSTPEPAS